MKKIEFTKMHGLGNDFVILDRRKNNFKITKEIVNLLSDRRTGAGCDQIITIDEKIAEDHFVSIKIFNPNGDTAEACGNGTRCIAKLLFEENNLDNVKIKSDAGILNAKKVDKNNISVNLGKISNKWDEIPLSKNIDTSNIPIAVENLTAGVAVNIGNPHVVFFGSNISNINLEKYGPEIENHSLFPNRTNVELVEIHNRKKITMRVWERGAGITLACGSGACAAVYAGNLKNLIENKVEVQVSLGSLFIEIINNEAIMTGPAEISYKGYINI